MSVTFYVEGWHEASMVEMPVYAKDEYPILSREDFVYPDGTPSLGYHLDKNGEPYRIEKVPANDLVWPEVNRNNSNAAMDIRTLMSRQIGNLDEEDFVCGSLCAEAVQSLPYECIPPALSSLISFARQRGKGIYWA